MINMPYFKTTVGILMVLILVGCSGTPSTTPDASFKSDVHNFTLILACNGTGLVRVNMTGNGRIQTQELARSNCSVHVSRNTFTIRCPQYDMRRTYLAEQGARLLDRANHRSDVTQT